jgi:hypothetical protein
MAQLNFRFYGLRIDFGKFFLDCHPDFENSTLYSKPLQPLIVVNLYNGKVMTATTKDRIEAAEYSGSENQFWFWIPETGHLISKVL